MANPKRPVVLRFVFGKGLVKSRPSAVDPFKATAQNIMVNAADDVLSGATPGDQFRNQVYKDVNAELVHMGSLFRRHIIGAGKTLTAPRGNLTTVSKGKGSPSTPISQGTGTWRKRSKDYLMAKQRGTGGQSWFDNTGWKSRTDSRFAGKGPKTSVPKDAGRLRNTFKGKTDVFSDIFGPVRVDFKIYSNAKRDVVAKIRSGQKKVKTDIGRLEVRALGNITPAMLGAGDGSIHPVSKMHSAVYAALDAPQYNLGERLGTMRNGVYRPTVEPFLAFFLTRSLPHAISERIKKGGFGAINRSSRRR